MSHPLRDLGGADPYQVLGVTPDATPQEVTQAYRRLIRHLHPDVSPHDEEAAKLVNLAREVLRDPELRAEYDLSSARRSGQRPDGSAEADDLTDEEANDKSSTSAWDADDIVTGVPTPPPRQGHPRTTPPRPGPAPPSGPPPWQEPPLNPTRFGPPTPHPESPYFQAPYNQPPYTAPHPPVYAPPRSSTISLGVWALISCFLCGPVGLILGIVALTRRPPGSSSDRVCAIIAVVWSLIGLACYGGYFMLALATTPLQ